VVSFVNHKQHKEGEIMVKITSIESIELATRWISVAASAVLLGLQVTKLIKTPSEDTAVDKSEE